MGRRLGCAGRSLRQAIAVEARLKAMSCRLAKAVPALGGPPAQHVQQVLPVQHPGRSPMQLQQDWMP